MKTIKVLTVFFLTLSLASVAACSSATNKEGTGEYFDDSVITTKVKAAIFADKSLSVAEINVETFKGVVQLSGFVNSQQDINTAMRLTRAVGGVTAVENGMRVK